MTEVTLTWAEVAMAAGVGTLRQITALRDRRPDRHGAASTGRDAGWSLHIEGAAGELAVAKCLDRHWQGSVNTFHLGGDVGLMHVRTRSRHDYELIVRDDDPDDGVFVLVTGTIPHFRVVGFIRAGDAKRNEWRANHGNNGEAFFAPHEALMSL